MQTPNMADEKLKKLIEIFPNIVTETIDKDGNLVRAIDKDILTQEISTKVIEGREERYQFTWPDKRQAIIASNAPTSNTLRPCREESVCFDETENLYIEGDNLEVLKILQETYLGKIKMIYIDPPYNTGNDFVYNDNFKSTTEEYLENSGQYDEEGNRLEKNLESNGRFHTDWLNMIYPRLKLARNLLSEDGVIFISIDENEQENLKKVCNEIFGENNFIANFIWQKNFAPKNDNKYISISTESVFLISRNKPKFNRGLLPREKKHNKGYSNPDNDYRGDWTSGSMLATTFSESGVFEIISPSGEIHLPAKGRCWRFSKEKVQELIKDNRIWFGNDGKNVPRVKRFLNEMPDGIVPQNLLLYKEVGSNQDGNKELKEIFETQLFNFPKNTSLLRRFLIISNFNDGIVLDFFSGSATTAHATMQLNAEDGGNRKFIMVQLPEETDEKSEAYKAGYKNICEIGKERIRRAGKKIIEENKDKEGIEDLDIGFRVLKVDSSNMKDVYYTPDQTEQSFLDAFEDNIKEDRSAEDLLFQVMLDLGVPLSSKIERKVVEGKEIFFVEEGYLIACFDSDINDETVKVIAKKEPYYAIFRDSSMASDSVATNFEQIFESISPQTVRKVI